MNHENCRECCSSLTVNFTFSQTGFVSALVPLSLTAALLSLTFVCSFPYFPNAFYNHTKKNGALCFMLLQIGKERLLHSKESENYEYRSAGSCYNADFWIRFFWHLNAPGSLSSRQKCLIDHASEASNIPFTHLLPSELSGMLRLRGAGAGLRLRPVILGSFFGVSIVWLGLAPGLMLRSFRTS